jgi:hypothetical protein
LPKNNIVYNQSNEKEIEILREKLRVQREREREYECVKNDE